MQQILTSKPYQFWSSLYIFVSAIGLVVVFSIKTASSSFPNGVIGEFYAMERVAMTKDEVYECRSKNHEYAMEAAGKKTLWGNPVEPLVLQCETKLVERFSFKNAVKLIVIFLSPSSLNLLHSF